MTLWEKALGPDHINVAASLSNLALVYQAQGRDAEAEPLCQRALAINEKALGPDHPDVAVSLNNLALVYQARGRYADAEPLFKRSLTIREKALGPDHPDVAHSLNNLAALYQVQGRDADALSVVQKVIARDNANKLIAFAVLYQSSSQNLISPTEALKSSYNVLQRSASSAAGKAVSLLAARFAAGSNELAQLVRKDQDFITEAERLNKNIVAAVSKPPTQRNAAVEEQIRKRIEELKFCRVLLAHSSMQARGR